MTSDKVRGAYSGLADVYIEVLGSLGAVHPGDLAFVEGHLGGVPGPVLDLGCGPGHLTAFLHSRGVDVAGIDLVPEFVAHARATHPGPRFEVGSLLDVDRPDASVAGVLAWFSLIHLEPDALDDALAAVRRLLTPGGVLVVGMFEGAAVEPFEHKVLTAYRWPVEEVARRLARTGLAEVDRLQRAQEGDRRPYLALAARA
ncbi:class I SAM-dependent methyltransferase [Blastococcus sp. TF02A-26]|uniref:class I SAM-dependent DNA methyltransferase n=1 Tax=Blastococcus sp. TF02A-26 TaxID=2250577 RepID=UPI000DEBA779|nr:class I SAM-dependent methyltransferase [Blastococcus sp. TF02A-26]RBY89883.1 SAM-dependent methyltransferase [Blastococcus sp. TF02A-26]